MKTRLAILLALLWGGSVWANEDRVPPMPPELKAVEITEHLGDKLPLGLPFPNPRDRGLEAERGTLRLMVRSPEVFTGDWNALEGDDFTHPTYRAIFGAVTTAGRAFDDWPQPVSHALEDPTAQQVIAALATEPLLRPASPAYAAEYVARLRLIRVAGRIAQLKSRLQRTNPVDEQASYNKMFVALLELEQQRRELTQVVAGSAE